MDKSIYNEAFYDLQSKESYESALIVLALLKNKLGDKTKLDSIIDFGCGVGSWLAAAKKIGFNDICGTDGDYVPEDRLLISRDEFFKNDLRDVHKLKLPERKFDLAISLEVAEHLPENSSCDFVEKITSKSDVVLFSAAIPYQGGHGHVNENWLSYWCSKFGDRGFICVDLIRPEIWNHSDVCWWYRQNLLVFIRSETLNILPVGTPLNSPVDIIHPEQYLESVHREKTQRYYTLNQDRDYFRNSLCPSDTKILSYGREYSYTEEAKIKINSTEELWQYANDNAKPVLRDALADVVENNFDLDLFRKELEKVEARPDFLCVGAQKSGTTWLYEVLKQQTYIWVPPIKELNFFNQLVFKEDSAFSGRWLRANAINRLHNATKNEGIDQNWLRFLFHLCESNNDIAWYSEIFKRCPNQKLSGEFTPEYHVLPKVGVQAIKELNPNMKIIMILRKPSERIKSHLRMIKYNCPEISNDVLSQLAFSHSVINRSDYKNLLNNWLSVFDRNQLFIGNYDELKEQPRSFLGKISNFLNVELNYESQVISKKIHTSKVSLEDFSLPRELIEKLEKFDNYWENFHFN